MNATEVEQFWPAILRVVEQSIDLSVACGMVSGGPSHSQVKGWLRRRPERRRELQAARIRSGAATGRRVSSYAAPAWEAALVFYGRVGAKPTERPPAGVPGFRRLRERAKRDPAFAARVNASLEAAGLDWLSDKPRPKPFADEEFAAALDHLTAHAARRRAADLDRELAARGLPTMNAVKGAALRHGWIADRLKDYTVAKYGRARRTHDEQAIEQALKVVQDVGARQAKLVLRTHGGRLPSLDAIYWRAKTMPAIRARLNASALRVRGGEGDYLLRQGLLQEDLYREASDIFGRGLPAELRDDMVSEVVVAVLEGEIERDEIKTKGPGIGWRYVRSLKLQSMGTLDRPAFRGGTVQLVDTLTTTQWSFEGAI